MDAKCGAVGRVSLRGCRTACYRSVEATRAGIAQPNTEKKTPEQDEPAAVEDHRRTMVTKPLVRFRLLALSAQRVLWGTVN